MTMFRMFFAAAVVCGVAATASRQEAAAGSLPKTVAVKDVLGLLEKSEIGGQGCGVATWKGEHWGMYVNGYKDPIKLPWNPERQRVRATFVYGRRLGEHQLIGLSGPGFRYRRETDVPVLTLMPPDEAK